MFAVRYVALAALVVWVGGMIGTSVVPSHVVAYACGGIILACLLVMKFVGPPPRAFKPRVAIVVLMLAVAAFAGTTLPYALAIDIAHSTASWA